MQILSKNLLERLPSTLGKLGSLKVLALDSNRLTILPDEGIIFQLAWISPKFRCRSPYPMTLAGLVPWIWSCENCGCTSERISLKVGLHQVLWLRIVTWHHRKILIGINRQFNMTNLRRIWIFDLQTAAICIFLLWISLRYVPDIGSIHAVGLLSRLERLSVSHNNLKSLPLTVGSLSNVWIKAQFWSSNRRNTFLFIYEY